MNWRKFRCYSCHKRWDHRTASVVYRSPEDVPLVVAGFVCKHCGTMFLIADRLIEGVAETLAALDKHNAARLS